MVAWVKDVPLRLYVFQPSVGGAVLGCLGAAVLQKKHIAGKQEGFAGS